MNTRRAVQAPAFDKEPLLNALCAWLARLSGVGGLLAMGGLWAYALFLCYGG